MIQENFYLAALLSVAAHESGWSIVCAIIIPSIFCRPCLPGPRAIAETEEHSALVAAMGDLLTLSEGEVLEKVSPKELEARVLGTLGFQ